MTERIAIACAAAMVTLRSTVPVFFEHAHFDSDQAVVGLMARHLALGEGFPLYFYGQQYLLGVEAWLAAPFLLLLGTSVAALKIPLLLLNVAICGLLIRLLVRQTALRPAAALVASVFLILPGPLAASRLVEAQGGNVTPLAFVVILWLARNRPVLFGIMFGLAYLNREFVAVVPVAWAAVAWVTHGLKRGPAVRFMAVALAACLGVFVAVAALTPLASEIEPVHTRPTVQLAPQHLQSRAVGLLGSELPMLFGAKRVTLREFNIASRLQAGSSLAGAALLAVLALGSVTAYRAGLGALPRAAFPLYLTVIGTMGAAWPVVVGDADAMQIRYVLLALFGPIGLVSLFFGVSSNRTLRHAVTVCCLIWTAFSLVDHVRLIVEYQHRPPPNEFRELAIYLENNDVKYVIGDYWVAYHVTYITAERVIAVPESVKRIQRYETQVNEHRHEAVVVGRTPCGPGVQLRRWYLCRP